MTLDEYQKRALQTAVFNDDEFKDTAHWVFGITGEAGEIAEKMKKIIRDKDGIINKADKQELVKEVGDVLWYLAVFAKQLNVSFEEIGRVNLDKLQSRKDRDVIKGSGDNR
jgi:NTP pyrophosphatase (non-canonical NTP hydrolase)